MELEIKPHPIFSVIWGIWIANVLAAIYLFPDAIVYHKIVVAAFFPPEITAALWNTGMRDTLSQVWTFLLRKFVKEPSVNSIFGWNAGFFVLLCHIAFLPATIMFANWGLLPAAVVFIGTMMWLTAHLWKPHIFG